MLAKVAFFALIGACAADFCVSDWNPRTCMGIPDGSVANTSLGCVPGYYETFETAEACNPNYSNSPTVNGTFCVNTWGNPHLCILASLGACVNYPYGYDSIQDCQDYAIEPTGDDVYDEPAVDGDVCVMSWSPRVCVATSSGMCAPGYYVGYDTIDECEDANGASDEPEIDGDYCVYLWSPRVCSLTSTGMCAPGYYVGYDSNEDCVAEVATSGASSGDTALSLTGDVCVTDWWPRACANKSDENVDCVPGYYQSFDSVEECEDAGGWAGEPDFDGDVCVTQWWPRLCGNASDENVTCVTGSYYGYSSVEECETAGGGWSAEEIEEPVCVFTWWPRLCTDTSTGLCAPGYTEGFDTIEECEAAGTGVDVGDAVLTNWTLDISGDVCVTDWWPRACANKYDENVTCVPGYYVGFDSVEECEDLGTSWSPAISGEVCVVSWYPRVCANVSFGMCTPGYYVGYDSVEECQEEGSYYEPDAPVVDDAPVCLFTWWPRLCSYTNTSMCAAGYTVGYDTIDECMMEGAGEVASSEIEEPYCLTQWWPRVCNDTSSGMCVAGQTFGYDSMAECEMSANYTDPSDSSLVITEPVCVFSWFPRLCSYTSSGFCAPGYYEGFQTIEECMLEDDSVDESVDGDWCVFSWYPRTCVNATTGPCVAGYTVGYDTLAECEGEDTSSPTWEPLVVNGDYCVTSWFPRTCGDTADDECVPYYYVGFDSMEDCLGEANVEDTSQYDGQWCQTQWWPVACGQYGTDECFFGTSNLHDSEAECMAHHFYGYDAMDDLSGFCLTQWWPRVCDYRSNLTCRTGSPTYTTMEECDPSPEPEDVSDKYCVTNWWPVACGQIGSSTCKVGSPTYDTLLECNPSYVDPMAPPEDYYCVTSWWPTKTCGLVEDGGCTSTGPGEGWTSEADCIAGVW